MTESNEQKIQKILGLSDNHLVFQHIAFIRDKDKSIDDLLEYVISEASKPNHLLTLRGLFVMIEKNYPELTADFKAYLDVQKYLERKKEENGNQEKDQ